MHRNLALVEHDRHILVRGPGVESSSSKSPPTVYNDTPLVVAYSYQCYGCEPCAASSVRGVLPSVQQCSTLLSAMCRHAPHCSKSPPWTHYLHRVLTEPPFGPSALREYTAWRQCTYPITTSWLWASLINTVLTGRVRNTQLERHPCWPGRWKPGDNDINTNQEVISSQGSVMRILSRTGLWA